MATAPNRPLDDQSAVDQYGPWVALFAAVGLTASGEFQLAQLVGFPWYIGWGLPVAIDIYVIQAMRRHRDVAAALLLMVATNALYHLGESGLFGVSKHAVEGHDVYAAKWWLIVAVVAVAPFIIWRIHRIKEDRPATEAVTAGVPVVDGPAPLPKAPAATTVPPAVAKLALPAATETPALPSTTVAPDAAPVADKTAPVVADNSRQNTATDGDSSPAKTTARKPARAKAPAPRAAAKKAPRRSLDEWVDIASPIFHAEFARLRRQPTANEFATAIGAAGAGLVSDSTAKNIRTEILDRTALPALDETP